ncbi:jg3808 [Pararge aegeria aegeria]|uniref:Jg3808 protein n=1 Tax=Pararge aegeria aegeria TaxID=348720 RepID=A0A8S4RUE5_9NEOP|nr:jg3808 [Pararge aegeria aegeria]
MAATSRREKKSPEDTLTLLKDMKEDNQNEIKSSNHNIVVKLNENAVEKRNGKIMFTDRDKPSGRVDERKDYAQLVKGFNLRVERTPASLQPVKRTYAFILCN